MDDSNVSNLIPQTINLFKLSDCANGLFPDQMWQTLIKLLETFLPKIDRHTLYIYLIARRNKDTLLQLNAQKTMNEAENYSGWVSSLAENYMETLKNKQVLPWVAIDSKTNIIIAASCQCAVCYSVIYANSLPSTSKENVWLETHPKRSVTGEDRECLKVYGGCVTRDLFKDFLSSLPTYASSDQTFFSSCLDMSRNFSRSGLPF
ncbi:hypothetical protein GHT06_018541 [Daphnia sinensis]|uniref:Uncharacterized protein n=1 Tax=Daphnia sinensis TaxID=1820382 RepID=A0AAD5L5A7_9CRUS|nr:hypothetical protein GHT06_018541 [Daphnia sinensis]